MSVREFAAHLGVSDRMVSKWEAGGQAIRPRPVNQAALDTSLARADDDVKARFAATAEGNAARVVRQRLEALPMPAATHLVRHPDDGKVMTLVDAGVYLAGPDATPTWLNGFYIDLYPTTNADYARFIVSTDHRPPEHWSAGLGPEARSMHPVVGVSWRDAQAYAAWASKDLPTGAEWEKAARGIAGSGYPWGDEATHARCNVRESRVKGTTPVDWYDNGMSPYGVYDMCGNVWEWCRTEHNSGLRELRGGAFSTPLPRAMPSTFQELSVDARRDDVGFRCVTSVASMLELLSI